VSTSEAGIDQMFYDNLTDYPAYSDIDLSQPSAEAGCNCGSFAVYEPNGQLACQECGTPYGS